MTDKMHKATHTGTLEFGDIIMNCAVLEGGIRVLSERSIVKALGGKRGGSHWRRRKKEPGADLPIYVSASNLIPHIPKDLYTALKNRYMYRQKGGRALGVAAEALPLVCDTYLKARDAGDLHPSQEQIAKAAEILMRGLAHVGIIALVDEATNYQEIRDRQALRDILDKYLRKEYAEWSKRFPDEFYIEMFRLRGWQWRGMRVNRPSVVGKYTNDLVWDRLAPGVLVELQRLNPKDDKGNRKVRHHQFLTQDIGHPRLAEHLYATMAFMRSAATWEQFHRSMQRAFPKINTTGLLNFSEDDV